MMTDKEIIEYVDDYIDMGCFRNPKEARPYLLDGFQLGYNKAKAEIEQEKINKEIHDIYKNKTAEDFEKDY